MAADFSDLERDFPHVVQALRSGRLPDPQAEQPSPKLWNAIAAAVTQEQSGLAPAPNNFELRVVDERPLLDPTPTLAPAGDGERNQSCPSSTPFIAAQTGEFEADVVDISPRRLGRLMAVGFAGAAAVLLVGLPLYLGLRGGSEIEGAVELAAIGGTVADGQAAMQGRTLSVGIKDLEAAPDSSTYALWLLQVDTEGNPVGIELIGTLDDNASVNQSFEIPAEIDTNLYSVVDISIEPNDGDESHSGNSILRGNLTQS